MDWFQVARYPDRHAYLKDVNGDLKPITEHLLTFYLSGQQRPDAYQHPFFIGRGDTPALAEQAAHVVYLRARDCIHEFTSHNPVTQVCRHCGVFLRVRASTEALRAARPSWLTRFWFRR